MISSCVQAEVVEGLDRKLTTQKSVVAELKQRLKKGQQNKQLEDVQAAKRPKPFNEVGGRSLGRKAD